MASTPQCVFAEITLKTRSGLRLAAKVWTHEADESMRGSNNAQNKAGRKEPIRILALHGWTDNAGTWDLLAPLLVRAAPRPIIIVCLDFAGHGRSEHRPDGVYGELCHVHDTADVLEQLRWKKCILMGHSMGGAVSLLLAAALPEKVERLFIVDTLGSWTRNASETASPENFQEHFKQYSEHVSPQRRVFATRAAGAARLREVDQYIGVKSAEILMRRGMIRVDDGYQYSYDTALRGTSPQRFDEEQLRAIYAAIECPILFIFGKGQKRFWGNFPEDVYKGRLKIFKKAQSVELDGGHHIHLDDPELVFKHCRDFVLADSATTTAIAEIKAKL